MNKVIFIIGVLLFLILSSLMVSSIGLRTVDGFHRIDVFESGLEKEYFWEITQSPGINKGAIVTIEGPLEEYFTVEPSGWELLESGKVESFVVKLKLPEVLEEYGTLGNTVCAEDVKVSDGQIAARTRSCGSITIISLAPGKKFEANLKTENAKVGEDMEVDVYIRSLGKEDISELKADVSLYGPDGKILDTVSSESIALASGDTQNLKLKFSTAGYSPSGYKIKGIAIGDGVTVDILEYTFKIGGLDFILDKTSYEVYAGRLSSLKIGAVSLWPEMVQVGGELTFNGNTYKAAVTEVPGDRTGLIEFFVDATSIEMGQYPASIKLSFEGETKVLDTVINVVEAPEDIVEEEPEETPFITNWMIYGLLGIVILIALFAIFGFRSGPPRTRILPENLGPSTKMSSQNREKDLNVEQPSYDYSSGEDLDDDGFVKL